ncbi:MAG: response regulator [Rhodanobacteraceae bacterium]
MEQNASATGPRGGAKILLAEDDPASGRFLSTAMKALGCHVACLADGRAALNAATTERFDLLVIDLKLPKLDGAALLQQLRDHADAASRTAPAIATSAEWDDAQRQATRDAGFAGMLQKPCTASQLQHMLETHLDFRVLPVCLDGAALQAAGGAANLAALRRLFAEELSTLGNELPALCQDRSRLVERLHRLCASAGFCGAPALAAACRQWLAMLRDDERCDEGRVPFEEALAAARRVFPGKQQDH